MRLKARSRTLLAQSLLWTMLPLSIVIIAIVITGAITYQRVVASLLIDRDRQLAALSAARFYQSLEEFILSLEDFRAIAAPPGEPEPADLSGVHPSEDLLNFFNAGILVFDPEGRLLRAAPEGVNPVGADISSHSFFEDLHKEMQPTFSDVLADRRTGQDMVVIAIPILGRDEEFNGGLLGAIHLHTSSLSDPVKRLSVGDEGFAYLVDQRGRVIFHPDPNLIGSDFSDRPAVARVSTGTSGGLLWESPEEGRLVQGYAQVAGTGWGLIVREPWEAVIEPVQVYVAIVGVVVLIVLLATAVLLWRGQQRIVTPIRSLVAQSRRLASGEKTESIPLGGILEIDILARAFDQMADRIESYRAGLRRYVGAMTVSQEEERRRIARELHDETVQNLVAILRGIELLQTELEDQDDEPRLQDLQTLVEETMRGVRQISRNLRPPALEDLGFVPALRSQVEMTRREGLNTELRIIGEPRNLAPGQELALYRIAQEALTNVRKHAQANLVQVELTFGKSSIQMAIADDGVGFDLPDSLTEWAQMGSFGLMGIQERAWGIGGDLEISSHPDEGTVLRVDIPAAETNGQSHSSS